MDSATNRKRPANGPKNTAIYVTELPQDITTDELVAHFSKCGIIMDEIMTGKPRVKLYCNEDGSLKGDALVVYLREESVNLALTILDESEIRPNNKIRVQEASNNKNNSSEGNQTEAASENKRTRVDKETWKKHMKRMQKKLEWFDEEGEAQAREAARQERFSKILVLKNMYRPEELTESLDFSLQLAEEIAEECEEKLGVTDCSVQVVEERAEEGMCTVKFKKAIEAQLALKLMNGRFFAGQRVVASIYDGSFPLPKKKTTRSEDPDEQARLEAFSAFIEGEGRDSESENENESENETGSESDNSENDISDREEP